MNRTTTYLLTAVLLMLPAVLMAQAAGGTIKRPVKQPQVTQQSGKTEGKQMRQQKLTETQAERDRILNNLINNMVHVEGGTFTMGTPEEQCVSASDSERPVHIVTLSSFSIGKYEVTQEEWIAVMGRNPSKNRGMKRPVENISWNDCQRFISKLNTLTGLKFRMPTEAEWEYAAYGGNRSKGFLYAGSNDVDNVAWYEGNCGGLINDKPHEVGKKQPNELGLYDMSGNVYEWCQDWKGTYSAERQVAPQGPVDGTERVVRGGCCSFSAWACRSSCRSEYDPSTRLTIIGLRLVLQ